MQLGLGELAGQREGRTRIADETEHDMWILAGVEWIGCRRHG
jgi:hypothetical protein